jgi:hypothetical protein
MFSQLTEDKGTILILVAFMLPVVFGFSALCVDVGLMYHEKVKMQSVAEAAALGGAAQIPDWEDADTSAQAICQENGYTGGEDVNIQYHWQYEGHPDWYGVTIEKTIPLRFARIWDIFTKDVSASAAASFVSSGSPPIWPDDKYGLDDQLIQNLSLFGPYAKYSYGDCYSTLHLNNGDPNPNYDPDGYNFEIEISEEYAAINGTSEVWLELFDPDTWNMNGRIDKSQAAEGELMIDEMRTPSGGNDWGYETTTRYSLYDTNGTPGDYSDDTLIAESTYTGPRLGESCDTDMKWVLPDGFYFDTSDHSDTIRLNVKTLTVEEGAPWEGASENGFMVRAGPPRAEEQSFNPDNGTDIMGVKRLPINFNDGGQVTLNLGYIPPDAVTGNIYVRNFDTDCGAQTVEYYFDDVKIGEGSLSGNGEFVTDVLQVEDDYPEGFTLYAKYTSGTLDTSSWAMWFDGRDPHTESRLRLVR